MIDPKIFALESLVELRRSIWTVVSGLAIGLSVALIVLHNTEKVYEARVDIYAAAENLPEEFIQPTISDQVELRLTPLRESVLAFENLRAVVGEVFPRMTDEARVNERILELQEEAGFLYDPREKIIQISYQDTDSERAATIANLLADIMIRENLRYRQDKARELSRSVELLARQTDERLSAIRDEMSDLRSQHPREVESERLANERALQDLRGALEAKEREIIDAEDRLRLLEASRSTVRTGVDEPPARSQRIPKSETATEIARLRAEVEDLRRTYADQHPEITRRLAQIAALEQPGSDEEAAPPPVTAPQPDETEASASSTFDVWAVQIEAARLQVQRLRDEERKIRADIARYGAYLRNTPEIQRRIDELADEIGVLKELNAQYEMQIQQADTGERIEDQAMANPFEILHPAFPPMIPMSPKVFPILAAGALIGVVVFVGPLVAKNFLSPIVRSQDGMVAAVDYPVLARIPLFETVGVRQARRRLIYKNVGLSLAAIAVLVTVVVVLRLELV